MKSGHYWARNFTVDSSDLDYLINLLLERETPLTSEQLSLALIEERLEQETAALRERYKDVRPYNPAASYAIGQRLVFPAMDYVTGVIIDSRPGDNDDYGPFTVIAVEFEDSVQRDFAADFQPPHILNQEGADGTDLLTTASDMTAEGILQISREEIVSAVEKLLMNSDNLVRLVGQWFPIDLMLDVNVGHLNLAEAVLDLANGGPLSTEEILEQMGGLENAPLSLQIFSLIYALNKDPRFDEVGAVGAIRWYLTRLEPQEVLETPLLLGYESIDYDRNLLTRDMLALETEIGDELSPLIDDEPVDEASIVLIYPHRRLGTLPLNAKARQIFPTAKQTPRIWVTLVDGQDEEEFSGWVVRGKNYVYGLGQFYRKHHLPVGAFVTVRPGDKPGKVVVDYMAHRPRTEWIRLIVPQNGQLHFENHKRAIGAAYDELMILGVDDLQTVDTLSQAAIQQQKSLSAILHNLIPELGRLSPQGTVHLKTLYSAVNVMRRCPPGPIMATLSANPDFEDVGGHYWKLKA